MKNVYAYYNMKGRLIRVKEDTLSHFKDITPHSVHKVAEGALKASYLTWRHTGEGNWKHIATLDFFADAEEIQTLTDNFKGLADSYKPARAGSKVTPELAEEMKRMCASGLSMYRVAQLMNVDKSTVRHHVKGV